MRTKSLLITLLLLLGSMLLSACDVLSEISVPDAADTDEAITTPYNAPDWTNFELLNATTGETIRLSDYAGRTVFVEPMATWCSNCRTQQRNVAQAMSELSADDYIFFSLSIDNVSVDALNTYAQRNTFTQQFLIASPELLNALTEQYGRTIVTPPSTPHFVIAPDGTLSQLSTGIHSSSDIVLELEEISGAQ